jgi:AcrR family transcriptional regulator
MSKRRGESRARILEAASRLFYEEGVHPAGVEAIVGEAGVSKPTLYSVFGSKQNLVEEVLLSWDHQRREALSEVFDDMSMTPAERILAVFDWLEGWFSGSTFQGCGLANTYIELLDTDGEGAETVRQHKRWVAARLTGLAAKAGLQEPRSLGEALLLLMEGATVMAAIWRTPEVALRAKSAAAALLSKAEIQP